MNTLYQLFEQFTGEQINNIQQLTASGSNRTYFRIVSASHSYIGVKGTSVEENKAFFAIAEQLKKHGINVPKVVAQTSDFFYYLQEDLGNVSLFELIEQKNDYPAETKEYLHQTMALLPDIQFLGAINFDFSVCYPQSNFNIRTIFWDLNYFKYNFLKTQKIDFQEDLLENDFEHLANILLNEKDENTFMYRDFQSRNIMIHNQKPYFIDFQGGRKGPIYYDVASFLWQAKAGFSNDIREELLQTYLKNLAKYKKIDEKEFKKKLNLFVLFRTLQVLGAYGFRGYFEKKAHFLKSIPFAIKNLQELLSELDSKTFPHLYKTLQKIVAIDFGINHAPAKLTVKIFSFSYRKGIPDDYSGNGGGYVFDCRAIHNPGRYEVYKRMTGLDNEVQTFLENDGEILSFLNRIYDLADFHVEKYLKRGFSDLQFAFGCTGGQHRSVYAAEHLAKHLASKYAIRIELRHREQNILKIIDEKES